MSETFGTVVNMGGDLAHYNLLIASYNFQLVIIRNLLIELEECQTSEMVNDVCNDITEAKETCQFFLEEIENTSTELISEMRRLDDLLEDYT